MKILITGANGYIGKHLVNAFISKYEISTLTRTECDLLNFAAVKEYFSNKHFDVVIHTAACGGNRLQTETSDILDQNLQMYYNLLAQKNNYNKFIYFGSGAEIFKQDTLYGLSKAIINESVKDKKNFYNIRIFAVFDENENDRRFIKSNIKRYKNKEDLLLLENKKMDFFYIKDLLSVVDYYITNSNLPKTFDCTYEETYTLYDIANFINCLDTYKGNIKVEDKVLKQNYCGTYTPLLPYIGLKKGLKEVFEKL